MFEWRRILTYSFACAAFAACGGDSGSSLSRYPTSADAADAGTGDDTFADAVQVRVGSTSARTLFPVGDHDYFAVTLEAGVEYELSTWGLCVTCDTYLTLFDVDGTTVLDTDDDYIGLDSEITFTPDTSGTYYVAVRAYDEAYGLVTYDFRATEFVDADADGYSTLYDCNDGDGSLHFEATDVPADGIDQDCSGADLPLGTVADQFEDDDTAAAAGRGLDVLPAEWGYAYYTLGFLAGRERTIDSAGDDDWIRVTLPAHTQWDLNADALAGTSVMVSYFDADGTTVRAAGLENTTDAPVEVRIRITGSAGTVYAAYYYDLGVDVDGDGFYTRDWDSSRDCDDTDAAVNPDATDTPGDSVDSDCNGLD